MPTPFVVSVGAVGNSCIRTNKFFSQKQPWYRSLSKKFYAKRPVHVVSAISHQNIIFTTAQVKTYDDQTQKILDFIDKLSQSTQNVKNVVKDAVQESVSPDISKISESVSNFSQESGADLVKKVVEKTPEESGQILGGDFSSAKDALKSLSDSAQESVSKITESTSPISDQKQNLNVSAEKFGDTFRGFGNILSDKLSDSKEALKNLATSKKESISSVTDNLPEKEPIIESSKIESTKESIDQIMKSIELPKIESVTPPPPPPPTFTPPPPTPTPAPPPTFTPPTPIPTPPPPSSVIPLTPTPTPTPTPSFTPTPLPPAPVPLKETKSALSGLKSSGAESLDQAKESISGTFSGIGDQFKQISSSGTSAVDQVQTGIIKTIQNIGDEIIGFYEQSNTAFKNSLESVGRGVGERVGGVGAGTSEKIKELFDQLPPEVQNALEVSGAGINSILEFIREYPIASLSIIAFFSALISIIYYRSTFAGFAGELSPKESLNLLQENNNSLLVDIRSDEQRAEDGVPELKRGARKRASALPPESIFFPDYKFLKKVKNIQQLKDEIFVTYVAGLPSINRGTSVIFMDSDSDDKRVKEFARTLYELYLPNSFIMKGGFKSWEENFLPIKMDSTNYEVQTSEIIQDEIEVLKEKTEDVKETLSNPQILLGILVLVSSGSYIIINYEKTLQFVGFLGIIFTIANRVEKRYDSLDDVRTDVVNFLEFVGKLVEKAGFSVPVQGPEPVLQAAGVNQNIQNDDDIEVVLPEEEEIQIKEEKEQKSGNQVTEKLSESVASSQASESSVSSPSESVKVEGVTDGQKDQNLEQISENVVTSEETKKQQPQNGKTNFSDQNVKSE